MAEKVELPDFELLKRQPKAPNVSRVVARARWPNEHGTLITFTVERSRKGKDWWISASLQGLRMSNTLHTSKEDKAKLWIEAVQSGRISIK